jgi:type II secretory pathway predicted ATPase ExeA
MSKNTKSTQTSLLELPTGEAKPIEEAKSKLSLCDLAALAFGKNVKERDIFPYVQLTELHRALTVSVSQRSMAMVSGKAGIGKTSGVRAFTSRLPSNKYMVLYFGQDQDGSNILKRLARAFGMRSRFKHADMVMDVSQALCDNVREGGKEVVAVVDEAHLLDDRTLEDLRLLTNDEFDTSSPMSVILLGQQQLRLKLKSPRFEALNQRLRYRFFLEGFSLEETAAYIKHRLEAAGGDAELFKEEAMAVLFDASEGVPREINNLAALALLRAEALGLDSIDDKLLKQVLAQRELS